MKFSEIQTLARIYAPYRKGTSVINIIELAEQNGIVIKNSAAAHCDFDIYPLYNCHAIYVLNHGEYVIYYDENYEYANFAIAHELAHHILHHKSDGVSEHEDAQMLACAIIAPINVIKLHKLTTSEEISNFFNIPLTVAKLYQSKLLMQQTHKKHIITCNIIVIVLTIFTILFATIIKHNIISDTIDQNLSTNIIASSEPMISNDSYVYITKTGKKYHKQTCQYIKNTSTVIKLLESNAKHLGYDACKICFD